MALDITPGTIIEPKIENGWIDPRGKMHYVHMYGHYDASIILLNSELTDDDYGPEILESRGWIHLSLAAPGYVELHPRYKPTASQIDTMFELKWLSESGDTPLHVRMQNAVEDYFNKIGESVW